MKKFIRLSALLLAIVMTVSLFGCSGGGNTDTESKGEVSSENVNFNGETVTIIYEYQPSDEYGIDASRDRELDRIKELNEKFNVKIVMKKGPANYAETIVSSISSGTPVGNIIRVNGNKNYDFIRAGLCAPLDDAMSKTGIDMKAAHYDQNTNNYYNVNGNHYVAGLYIPQESNVGNLWFYNKDILTEMGYGANYINELYAEGKWNWANATALFKAATKTAANGTVTRYGFGAMWQYLAVTGMVLSNGGTIGTVAEDGSPKANLADAKVREALTQAYNWAAVDKVMCPSESDETSSKFAKGEIFMIAASSGVAKKSYNQGINFGVIYPATGTSGTGTKTAMNVGGGFIIPVTYKDTADKYLVLLDALYGPYEDASREDILKQDYINYFSDSESWEVFRNATFNTELQTVDPFTVFNLQWVEPAFGTVCLNLIKGTVTPGSVVDSYNDQYQAVLDDLFKEHKLTGIK